MTGVYKPDRGRIVFKGEDITRLSGYKIAVKGIARTFQNIELFQHMTLLDNLRLGRHRFLERGNLISEMLFTPGIRSLEIENIKKVEEVIDFLDLQPHRNTLMKNMPYGIQKIADLGRALVMEPELILIDEPAAGLNPEEVEDLGFWLEDILKDYGITIILVEHNMQLVTKMSYKILVLDSGRVLAEGTPDEIQSNQDVLNVYLGEETEGNHAKSQ